MKNFYSLLCIFLVKVFLRIRQKVNHGGYSNCITILYEKGQSIEKLYLKLFGKIQAVASEMFLFPFQRWLSLILCEEMP